ncbi:MAG: response regulator [Candidatus Eremiobacteraeota bacterium]|nr:response regulator [Candidatus Eremiobacteraeota bacterium]
MKKILIIDDDEDFSELVHYTLKGCGFSLMKAHDGESGMERAVKELPDLVLLDMVMPRKNGIEMLEELKSNEITGNIPVIMLSGYREEDRILQARQLGVVDYVTKPFSPLTLLQSVYKALGMECL